MMPVVRLKTVAQNKTGTYSALCMNDLPLCVTVERPWLNNKNGISCIPRGITAHFIKYLSPHNGSTWICQDIENRTNVEIHAANIPGDVEGCIGVGQYFNNFYPEGPENPPIMGVANAQATIAMLRKTLPDEFDLVIE